jgi:hypothetical protein
MIFAGSLETRSLRARYRHDRIGLRYGGGQDRVGNFSRHCYNTHTAVEGAAAALKKHTATGV